MNFCLFEPLGKYGGIGGISLGVFLLVVITVVKVSSKRLSKRSILILTMIVVFTLCISLAGLFIYPITMKKDKGVATMGGVATGGNIVSSDVVIRSQSLPRFRNASTGKINPATVTSEGGVSAGGDIIKSTIRINTK